MTTLEDIFSPYERNRMIYRKKGDGVHVSTIMICDIDGGQKISKTHIQFVPVLSISSQRVVKVPHILPKSILENLKIKHYIKIGEECPICFEPIFHKKNAFLTNCGHSFHYSCIRKYYLSTFFLSEGGILCPLCRGNADTWGFDDLKKIYFHTRIYPLDKLENFWSTIDLQLAQPCSNTDDHYIGMKNNCSTCLDYRSCRR